MSLLWTTATAMADGALVRINSSMQYCRVVRVSSTSSTTNTLRPFEVVVSYTCINVVDTGHTDVVYWFL